MRNKKGTILITLGVLLILAALSLTIYNVYDERRAGELAEAAAVQILEEIPEQTMESREMSAAILTDPDEMEIPDYILNPDMDMPVKVIDGWEYIGVLEIPVYDLVLPVISEWSYPALKVSPCRYAGSAYQDNLVIAGHNYRTHFSKVKNIAEGEPVRFTDMDGNVFEYEVVVREVLTPDAVEDMIGGDWDLTLFTCTYDGQNRVAVRCERVENGT